jgi:hypothetical protein
MDTLDIFMRVTEWIQFGAHSPGRHFFLSRQSSFQVHGTVALAIARVPFEGPHTRHSRNGYRAITSEKTKACLRRPLKSWCRK